MKWEWKWKWLWWVFWGLCFAAFIVLDSLRLGGISGEWLGRISAIIKFVAIASCFLYVLIHRRRNSLLVIALSLTLLADTLLFWTGATFWGVFTFCFAQIFHVFRFRAVKPTFLFGYGLSMGLVFLFLVFHQVEAIYALAFIYASLLLLNLFLSFKFRGFSFAGFLLFVLCDIAVALYFLSGNGTISPDIQPIAGFLTIIFYLPSQIFIVQGRDGVKIDRSPPQEKSQSLRPTGVV